MTNYTVVMNSGAGACNLTVAQAGNNEYAPASNIAYVAAQPAIPVITWPRPAAIVYGTALTATQLDASASAPGTFSYVPTLGAVLAPGNGQNLSVTFTPADTTDYSSVATVNQISIVLTGAFPASSTSCNGAYNGTFSGNLTVSAGQICIFYRGGVTGNVTQTGGTLMLIGAVVGGSVQVEGGGTFSFTGASKIQRNLQVNNLTATSGQNQICGSSIAGNFQYQTNAAQLLIGASPACASNTVNGNLQIRSNAAPIVVFGNTVSGSLQAESNTAPVSLSGNTVVGNLQAQNNTATAQVYNNKVKNDLQCSGNASITGGGNAAAQKQGQCASF